MIKRLAIVVIGSGALLSACGPGLIGADELQAAVMAEGEWGWNRGAGCEDRADMVVISSESLSYIKQGEPVFEATLLERALVRETTVGDRQEGRIQASDWRYTFTDASTGERVVRQDRMHVRYTAAGFRGLQFTYRYERRGDGDWDRVRPTDVERGDWLLPCEGTN